MTLIEERFEGGLSDRAVRPPLNAQSIAGRHRRFVGGGVADRGEAQLEFLRERGLLVTHRVLEVGCGRLQNARYLVDYLEPGNYWGIDANRAVLQAGYEAELSDQQRERLPLEHLRATDRFDIDFGVLFDVAITQSVFTQLSLNHIRLCLYRISRRMRPGGVLYASFHEQPPTTQPDAVVATKRPKYGERGSFWYYRDDIVWAASFSPWTVNYVGGWGHPEGEKLVELVRRAEASSPTSVRPVAASSSTAVPRSRSHAARPVPAGHVRPNRVETAVRSAARRVLAGTSRAPVRRPRPR